MESSFPCLLCGSEDDSTTGEDLEKAACCLLGFLREENLIASTEAPIFLCKLCTDLGETLAKLLVHLDSIKEAIRNTFLRREETRDNTSELQGVFEKPLSCVTCSKQFRSLKGYKNHIKKHEGKDEERDTFCKQCKRLFNTERQFSRHQFTVHSISVPTSCTSCGIRLDCEKSLAKHNQEVHSQRVVCNLCGKEFYTTANLIIHQRNIHREGADETNHICEFCSRTFKSTDHLKQHQRTHEGLKFSCNICDKRFRWDSSLNSHMKAAHSKSSPSFRCIDCGKCFKDRNNFKKHLFTHSDIKPYICATCGKGFIRKDLLKKHSFKCTPSLLQNSTFQKQNIRTY